MVHPDLRLVAQMDEESGEMVLLLVCKKCRQREIVPVPVIIRNG